MKSRVIFLLLSVVFSYSSLAEEFISYEKLVKGMSPAEAYVAGANKVFEYLEVSEDLACRFIATQFHSSNIEQMREFQKNILLQKVQEKLVTKEAASSVLNMSNEQFIFNLCKENDLASQQTALRLSAEDIRDELIEDNKGLFRAKFYDGSDRIVLMRMDNSVWKVKIVQ